MVAGIWTNKQLAQMELKYYRGAFFIGYKAWEKTKPFTKKVIKFCNRVFKTRLILMPRNKFK